VAAVAVGTGLAGLAVTIERSDDTPPQPPLTVPTPEPSPDTLPARVRVSKTTRPALPRQIAIPRIGLHARIVKVGLTPDRALDVPADGSVTGWWKGGSRPGEPGPAVIDGHVDSRSGPAVFFRLGALHAGDTIHIRRADGSAVLFTVRRVVRYSKSRFPTGAVYGATKRSTLRLITCSGDFDRTSGHYRDNTVVYASLAT
jgi:hypothetical protein